MTPEETPDVYVTAFPVGRPKLPAGPPLARYRSKIGSITPYVWPLFRPDVTEKISPVVKVWAVAAVPVEAVIVALAEVGIPGPPMPPRLVHKV